MGLIGECDACFMCFDTYAMCVVAIVVVVVISRGGLRIRTGDAFGYLNSVRLTIVRINKRVHVNVGECVCVCVLRACGISVSARWITLKVNAKHGCSLDYIRTNASNAVAVAAL